MGVINFTHADTDGKCSGAIVKRKFPGARIFCLDYKDPIPLEEIQENDILIITDFSLKPEIMNQVFERIKTDPIHLDHHITAFSLDYGRELPGIRKEGECGSLLTWKYYFPDEPIPVALKLVNDFDVWELKFKNTFQFIEGLRLQDTSPESDLWKRLLNPQEVSMLGKIIQDGEICLAYKIQICEEYVKDYGWETSFLGYTAYACGLYKFGSSLFGERIKKYDICLSYEYMGENNWQVGMYTAREDIEVGELCKQQGEKYGTRGGGHRQVGGFFVNGELPFKKITRNE